MAHVSQKLRDSAKGQECTMRIGNVCNHNSETTVLCHFPSIDKGMANKSPDYWAGFGCSDCHKYLDDNRLSAFDKQLIITNSLFQTWKVWIEMGLISIPKTEKKPKPLAKQVERKGLYE